jgi:tRNA-Thr(GGU) m(6)t(6)A37 methyltransferase TsaA
MYELEPIGIVHSPIKNSREMPLLGVAAIVRIFDAFLGGLTGIEGDSHINIIGWLDKAERAPLMVRPRKINPKLSPRGVFSMRSPARPNPLSLSAARLTKVDGPRLYVEPLDLIDGTPIVDIKPYSAGWDAIFWARDVHSALITQYMAQADALAELLREAFNFHGERCGAMAVAAKIAYDAAETLHVNVRDLCLQLPRKVDPHLADGLIGISRATMGNARLTFSEDLYVHASADSLSTKYRVLDVPRLSALEILELRPDELFLKS